MNMGKSGSWSLKVGEGCASVTLNFTALTLETCLGPLSYIAINVGPDISFGDQTLGCFDTWVGKVVEGVENGTAKCLRDKRS